MSGSLLIPISRVRASRKRFRDKDVLTPEEFQSLVEQLSIRDRAIVLLVGSTGLRRSEMIALTWSDLDVRTMEFRVLRSCVRNRFGKTKTEASCRPVPLHPIVLNALLNWRAESLYATDADFLFPSIRLKGHRPLSPDNLLKKSIRPAGIASVIHLRTCDESESTRYRHQSSSRVTAACEQPDDARYLHSRCIAAEAGRERKICRPTLVPRDGGRSESCAKAMQILSQATIPIHRIPHRW